MDSSPNNNSGNNKTCDNPLQGRGVNDKDEYQRRRLFMHRYLQVTASMGRSSILPQRSADGQPPRHEWANAVVEMVRRQEARKSCLSGAQEPEQKQPAPPADPSRQQAASRLELRKFPLPRSLLAESSSSSPLASCFASTGPPLNAPNEPAAMRPPLPPPPPSAHNRPHFVSTVNAYKNRKTMNNPREVIPRFQDLPREHYNADGSVNLQIQWVIAQAGYAHFEGRPGQRAVLVSNSWIRNATEYGIPRSVIIWLTDSNGGGILHVPASQARSFWGHPS